MGGLDLLLSPWKFQHSEAYPRKFHKIVFTHWNFQGQKPKPMEIPLLFLLNPGISTLYLFNTPGNSMSSTPHVWFFFCGIVQCAHIVLTHIASVEIQPNGGYFQCFNLKENRFVLDSVNRKLFYMLSWRFPPSLTSIF